MAVFSKPILIHQKHIDYLSKVDNTLKSIIENNTIPDKDTAVLMDNNNNHL